MPQKDIAWQLFDQAGQPIVGQSASREDFAVNKSLVMGAAHVWLWRQTSQGKELLLQRRATHKKTWPGYLDISVAGHVDVGETCVQAALREAQEEVGLTIDANKLYYIFSLRTPLDVQELDTVYLYELTTEPSFVFNDGEVEALQWVSLDTFRKMVQDAEAYKLVPQGDAYFSLLLANLAT